MTETASDTLQNHFNLTRAFIHSTMATFEMMLELHPEETESEAKHVAESTFDISGIVGLSGGARGSLVMSFPSEAACQLVGRMLEEDGLTPESQVVCDGIGEISNIVAGSAKRELSALGIHNLEISIPTVVVGRHRAVWCSRDLPCLQTRFFCTELGPFCMEVNVRAANA